MSGSMSVVLGNSFGTRLRPTALTSFARRAAPLGLDPADRGVLILVAAALALGSLWVTAFGAPVPLRC